MKGYGERGMHEIKKGLFVACNKERKEGSWCVIKKRFMKICFVV